jgi:hypothetical protein
MQTARRDPFSLVKRQQNDRIFRCEIQDMNRTDPPTGQRAARLEQRRGRETGTGSKNR